MVTTIGLWGSVHYGIDDEIVWTDQERQRHAFAGLCGPTIYELAGIPDVFEAMPDIESTIEKGCGPLYPAPQELCGQLIKTWIEALEFFGTPQVWGTADAFALATALGTGDPWEQHCWLRGYIMLD
jgi:hypothetical protein